MSWKINSTTVDDAGMTTVEVQYFVANDNKDKIVLCYSPLELPETQEDFYNKVVADIEARHSSCIKTQAEKDADDADANAVILSETEDFIAANEIDADYKLKDLTDADV